MKMDEKNLEKASGGILSNDLDDNYVVYTVQEGDTLSSIARFFCFDENEYHELARLNRIQDANLIYAGKKIMVPSLYIGQGPGEAEGCPCSRCNQE